MTRARSVLGWFLLFGILFGPIHALAQRDAMPQGYPQSLELALQSLLDQLHGGVRSPALLVQVSSTYFDIADDLLTEVPKRQAAYQAGAQAAKEAFTLDDSNADAHFFYAANLGSAERRWRLRSLSSATDHGPAQGGLLRLWDPKDARDDRHGIA